MLLYSDEGIIKILTAKLKLLKFETILAVKSPQALVSINGTVNPLCNIREDG